jgi:hypothetical protein
LADRERLFDFITSESFVAIQKALFDKRNKNFDIIDSEEIKKKKRKQ